MANIPVNFGVILTEGQSATLILYT